jgi:Ca2+-binding RTX toxin-like protein
MATINGSSGADSLAGTDGDDVIVGLQGEDTLEGRAGNDILDGGPGGDVLFGGPGDDTYYVDEYFIRRTMTGSSPFAGVYERVGEAVGEGFDTVIASASYGLIYPLFGGFDAGEVEVLRLADPLGTQPFFLDGNRFAQTITGNAGNNVIDGQRGDDTLIGLGGDDTYYVTSGTIVREDVGGGNDTVISLESDTYRLNADAQVEAIMLMVTNDVIYGRNAIGNGFSQRITGNRFDNVLNGGGATSGAGDTLVGLGGNDTYLVQALGDVVIEANGGGADIVYTTVSYNLGDNEVEALSTVDNSATTAINLVGNFVSQTIVGNYGNNLLNGGSGADTLIGLRGNDLYAVGDSRIVIREAAGEGDDTVVTSVSYALGAGVSVEVLSAQDRGSTTGLALTGNGFGQTIAGTAGADTLNGGGGNDVLIGGAGADRFAFTSALGSGNVDAIADFQVGTDRIGLASDVFAGVGATLDAGEFVAGTAAADADDRIIYNAASGQILYDADGNGSGAAVLFALVTPGTALTAASFEVIAPVATAV